MIPSPVKQHIRSIIGDRVNISIGSLDFFPISGGSINLAYEMQVNQREQYFCKINSVKKYPALFEKEMNGLTLLHREGVIRVPQVILHTIKDDYQVLILEWIEQEEPTETFWKKFGEKMGVLHRISATAFGLKEDNYIGALPQSNQPTDSWNDFFVVHRILPQVQMAMDRKLLDKAALRQFEKLFKQLENIFPPEPPALLHGDLWNGNFMCTTDDTPVLVDPAVYYGHRSMDLGMTTLFGGFEKAFYDAYHNQYALPPGHERQWAVCNLYPLLVHLNLFGNSYLPGIISTISHY